MTEPTVLVVFPGLSGEFGGAFNLYADLLHAVDRGDALVSVGGVVTTPAAALAEVGAWLGREFPEVDLDELRDHVRKARAS